MSCSPASSARFYLIDVFAQRPLTGNPLALVPDADDLAEAADARDREGIQPVRDHLRAGARGARRYLAAAVLHAHRRRGLRRRAQRARRLAPAGWPPAAGLRAGRVHPANRTRRCFRCASSAAGNTRWCRWTSRHPVFGAIAGDRAELARSRPGRAISLPVLPRRWPARGESPDGAGPRPRRGRSRPARRRASGHVLAHAGGEGATSTASSPDTTTPSRTAGSSIPSWGSPRTPLPEPPPDRWRRCSSAPARPPRARSLIEQGRALGLPSRIQVSVTGDQVTISGSGLVVADGTIRLE